MTIPIAPSGPAYLEDLERVVVLLHHAARAALEVGAESPAASSTWGSFSLGVALAHSRAAALLPDGVVVVDDDLGDDFPGDPTPLRFLLAAEEATRHLPLWDPELAGMSVLVVELGDLVREAGALDR